MDRREQLRNIFIIGSKGIPAKYGGFETFVEKLTFFKKSKDIKYHISCLSDNDGEFECNGARCFNVKTQNIGAAKAVLYDILALKKSINYIKENKIANAKIYILACRIGPFLRYFKKKCEKIGVEIYLNPDGHEWKRAKWNILIRNYWKISEKLMVKNSDLIICDSKAIEEYINEDYKRYNPKTCFIAYGADLKKSKLKKESLELKNWFKEKSIEENEYYLIVGRFVPENNYKLIIEEFMKSKTNKSLVIISNVEANKFYEELLMKTKFNNDKRIKFVGTVYDQELLKKIRELAFGYIHGHEVGGTNPSLLEALATTKLNLLLDVNFNREVGEEAAIYFDRNEKKLEVIIESIEELEKVEIEKLGILAKKRIEEYYSWNKIVDEYEKIFLKDRRQYGQINIVEYSNITDNRHNIYSNV